MGAVCRLLPCPAGAEGVGGAGAEAVGGELAGIETPLALVAQAGVAAQRRVQEAGESAGRVVLQPVLEGGDPVQQGAGALPLARELGDVLARPARPRPPPRRRRRGRRCPSRPTASRRSPRRRTASRRGSGAAPPGGRPPRGSRPQAPRAGAPRPRRAGRCGCRCRPGRAARTGRAGGAPRGSGRARGSGRTSSRCGRRARPTPAGRTSRTRTGGTARRPPPARRPAQRADSSRLAGPRRRGQDLGLRLGEHLPQHALELQVGPVRADEGGDGGRQGEARSEGPRQRRGRGR